VDACRTVEAAEQKALGLVLGWDALIRRTPRQNTVYYQWLMAPRVGLELLHNLLSPGLILRNAAQLPPKASPEIVRCGETA
jgi:hypothetical protein